MNKILVPGEGNPNAKVILVGEAPGQEEERARPPRPFIGNAGQELTKLMHLVGLPRSECYITNVVKERPPGNDFTKFLKFDRKGNAFETPEYKMYVEMLRGELYQMPANVIVAVGNPAMYTLTGKVGIVRRRGSIYASTLLPGRKVIPIIHPSAALRQYMYTHFIRLDLKRIIAESESPDIILPVRDIVVKPAYSEAIAFLEVVKTCNYTAVDIEVMNEEVSCISFAPSPSRGISIPFVSGGNDYFAPEQELSVWLRIANILEDQHIVKVFQNGAFDCSFLYNRYGIKTVNIDDTMIAQAIARPDFPKGLDFITSVYTKEPYYKDEGKKWFRMGGSERDFWVYNAKDSLVCIEALPKIEAEVTRQNNNATYNRQVRLIPPLMYIQERGMRVNVEGMKKASNDALESIKANALKFGKIVNKDVSIKVDKESESYLIVNKSGGDITLPKNEYEKYRKITPLFNIGSNTQLADHFYRVKGLKPYYKGKSITTDDDALRRIARKGIEEAIVLRNIRKMAKLKSTYFDMQLTSSDNRLRSAMNPVGTRYGRLSSSEDIFGQGGNIQNLPDVFRYFIMPDEGYVMYNVDLSQAENRIVAYIAPEPLMKESFETGVDVHSRTANLLSGLPYDEIKAQDAAGIKCNLGTGEFTWRFWGKKSNHSFNYDLGYITASLKLDMPQSQAKALIERYHTIYPGVRQYHAWVKNALAKNRQLTNLMGRTYVFLNRWGDQLFKDAYAFIPQSTVADIINERGVNYIYYDPEQFEFVELLDQVHDSTVFQIPISVGWEYHAAALMLIKRSLEQSLLWHGTEFVIPAEVSMCITLGKKDMKGVKIDAETTIKGLAEQLHEIHSQHRAVEPIQAMDSDLSDSFLSSEEMQSSLGDDADFS